MIVVTAQIRVRPELGYRLQKMLLSVVFETRKEPGCLLCLLHQSLQDPNQFLFIERWTDQKALEVQLKKSYVTSILEKTDEYFSEPLELSIWKEI